MKCPGCQFVCADTNDICLKCYTDLRPAKMIMGLPITNPDLSIEELINQTLGHSPQKKRKKKKKKGKPTKEAAGIGGLLKGLFGQGDKQPKEAPDLKARPEPQHEPEPIPAEPLEEESPALTAEPEIPDHLPESEEPQDSLESTDSGEIDILSSLQEFQRTFDDAVEREHDEARKDSRAHHISARTIEKPTPEEPPPVTPPEDEMAEQVNPLASPTIETKVEEVAGIPLDSQDKPTAPAVETGQESVTAAQPTPAEEPVQLNETQELESLTEQLDADFEAVQEETSWQEPEPEPIDGFEDEPEPEAREASPEVLDFSDSDDMSGILDEIIGDTSIEYEAVQVEKPKKETEEVFDLDFTVEVLDDDSDEEDNDDDEVLEEFDLFDEGEDDEELVSDDEERLDTDQIQASGDPSSQESEDPDQISTEHPEPEEELPEWNLQEWLSDIPPEKESVVEIEEELPEEEPAALAVEQVEDETVQEEEQISKLVEGEVTEIIETDEEEISDLLTEDSEDSTDELEAQESDTSEEGDHTEIIELDTPEVAQLLKETDTPTTTQAAEAEETPATTSVEASGGGLQEVVSSGPIVSEPEQRSWEVRSWTPESIESNDEQEEEQEDYTSDLDDDIDQILKESEIFSEDPAPQEEEEEPDLNPLEDVSLDLFDSDSGGSEQPPSKLKEVVESDSDESDSPTREWDVRTWGEESDDANLSEEEETQTDKEVLSTEEDLPGPILSVDLFSSDDQESEDEEEATEGEIESKSSLESSPALDLAEPPIDELTDQLKEEEEYEEGEDLIPPTEPSDEAPARELSGVSLESLTKAIESESSAEEEATVKAAEEQAPLLAESEEGDLGLEPSAVDESHQEEDESIELESPVNEVTTELGAEDAKEEPALEATETSPEEDPQPDLPEQIAEESIEREVVTDDESDKDQAEEVEPVETPGEDQSASIPGEDDAKEEELQVAQDEGLTQEAIHLEAQVTDEEPTEDISSISLEDDPSDSQLDTVEESVELEVTTDDGVDDEKDDQTEPEASKDEDSALEATEEKTDNELETIVAEDDTASEVTDQESRTKSGGFRSWFSKKEATEEQSQEATQLDTQLADEQPAEDSSDTSPEDEDSDSQTEGIEEGEELEVTTGGDSDDEEAEQTEPEEAKAEEAELVTADNETNEESESIVAEEDAAAEVVEEESRNKSGGFRSWFAKKETAEEKPLDAAQLDTQLKDEQPAETEDISPENEESESLAEDIEESEQLEAASDDETLVSEEDQEPEVADKESTKKSGGFRSWFTKKEPTDQQAEESEQLDAQSSDEDPTDEVVDSLKEDDHPDSSEEIVEEVAGLEVASDDEPDEDEVEEPSLEAAEHEDAKLETAEDEKAELETTQDEREELEAAEDDDSSECEDTVAEEETELEVEEEKATKKSGGFRSWFTKTETAEEEIPEAEQVEELVVDEEPTEDNLFEDHEADSLEEVDEESIALEAVEDEEGKVSEDLIADQDTEPEVAKEESDKKSGGLRSWFTKKETVDEQVQDPDESEAQVADEEPAEEKTTASLEDAGSESLEQTIAEDQDHTVTDAAEEGDDTQPEVEEEVSTEKSGGFRSWFTKKETSEEQAQETEQLDVQVADEEPLEEASDAELDGEKLESLEETIEESAELEVTTDEESDDDQSEESDLETIEDEESEPETIEDEQVELEAIEDEENTELVVEEEEEPGIAEKAITKKPGGFRSWFTKKEPAEEQTQEDEQPEVQVADEEPAEEASDPLSETEAPDSPEKRTEDGREDGVELEATSIEESAQSEAESSESDQEELEEDASLHLTHDEPEVTETTPEKSSRRKSGWSFKGWFKDRAAEEDANQGLEEESPASSEQEVQPELNSEVDEYDAEQTPSEEEDGTRRSLRGWFQDRSAEEKADSDQSEDSPLEEQVTQEGNLDEKYEAETESDEEDSSAPENSDWTENTIPIEEPDQVTAIYEVDTDDISDLIYGQSSSEPEEVDLDAPSFMPPASPDSSAESIEHLGGGMAGVSHCMSSSESSTEENWNLRALAENVTAGSIQSPLVSEPSLVEDAAPVEDPTPVETEIEEDSEELDEYARLMRELNEEAKAADLINGTSKSDRKDTQYDYDDSPEEDEDDDDFQGGSPLGGVGVGGQAQVLHSEAMLKVRTETRDRYESLVRDHGSELTSLFDETLPYIEEEDDQFEFELTADNFMDLQDREDIQVLFEMAGDLIEDPDQGPLYVEETSRSHLREVDSEEITEKLEEFTRTIEAPLGLKGAALHGKAKEQAGDTGRDLSQLEPAPLKLQSAAFAMDLFISACLALISAALYIHLQDPQLLSKLLFTPHLVARLHWFSSFTLVLISFLLWLPLYPLLCYPLFGMPLGVELAGLAVLREDGEEASFSQILVRGLSFPLSFLLFGYTPTLLGRPALHDAASRTRLFIVPESFYDDLPEDDEIEEGEAEEPEPEELLYDDDEPEFEY